MPIPNSILTSLVYIPLQSFLFIFYNHFLTLLDFYFFLNEVLEDMIFFCTNTCIFEADS